MIHWGTYKSSSDYSSVHSLFQKVLGVIKLNVSFGWTWWGEELPVLEMFEMLPFWRYSPLKTLRFAQAWRSTTRHISKPGIEPELWTAIF